jgi:Ni/Co efflux regulator RcnB
MRALEHVVMRTLLFTIVLCASALAPVACSERDQAETNLEPWDSPQAGGPQAVWQRDIKARMRNQNDYQRIR